MAERLISRQFRYVQAKEVKAENVSGGGGGGGRTQQWGKKKNDKNEKNNKRSERVVVATVKASAVDVDVGFFCRSIAQKHLQQMIRHVFSQIGQFL